MICRLLIASAVIACGCHHPAPKATTPPAITKEPVARVETPPSEPAPASSTSVSANLSADDGLVKACTVHFQRGDEAPKFEYNAVELLPSDRDVLDQIATCLTTGPLRGKSIEVVGHADPRGTDEYNLGLGDRRARSVGEYLSRLGVQASRIATTTRGELDARGGDEASWSEDRRVDLHLN